MSYISNQLQPDRVDCKALDLGLAVFLKGKRTKFTGAWLGLNEVRPTYHGFDERTILS